MHENGDTFVRLAEVQLQRQEWAGAADALQKALSKGGLKDTGNTQLLMGIALYSNKQPKEARNWFEKAATHDKQKTQAQAWIKHIDADTLVLVRARHTGEHMPLTITFQLTDRDLAHLGDVVNKAKANASSLGEADIIRAARESLKDAGKVEVADFIRERLDKLDLLVQMLEDRVWELSGADRARITNALAYFADPDDIIPGQRSRASVSSTTRS